MTSSTGHGTGSNSLVGELPGCENRITETGLKAYAIMRGPLKGDDNGLLSNIVRRHGRHGSAESYGMVAPIPDRHLH